jgi:signal transduction histidine kinase
MEEQNVLIVEDDAAVSQVVAELLTEAGYRPITVEDHTLISQMVERWRPRCVLLDGELTRSGESRSWRDAAAIRLAHPALPVVLFTGDAAVAAEARAARSYRSRAAGFAAIIGKPFAIEELVGTVKTAVERGRETDVFGMILHELRQPLTVMRGQLQLARRHLGADMQSERLVMDNTLAQVDRMDHLIDQLSDHARLGAEGFSLDMTLFDLAATLDQAIALHEPGAPARIHFERPSGAVPIRGDPGRIQQIVDNLLSNAVKYSPAASPIEISLTTDGVDAQVRVTDHGIGVPDAERARLFTPFYRTSRAVGIRGTGLGLHISRRLAEHHGGRLWLDASSSGGTVFAFVLPLARSDPATRQS